jgi:carboxymethylenebutenolidase
MGEMLTLTAEDGFKLSAYKATPAGKPRGALVVIQEIFGVNHHIKSVTDRFAKEGYLSIAPALFDRVERGFESGYQQADIERGRAVRGKLAIEDAIKDVRAAVKEAAKSGLKVGVVGYCFGGTMAWLSATRIDGVSAAIAYYGGGVADAAAEKPKCPVIFHWGETDASIPIEKAREVAAAHKDHIHHFYADSGHGFNCEQRGSYNSGSAKVARERSLEFIRKHVG